MRIARLVVAAAVLALVACGGADEEQGQTAAPRRAAPTISGTTLDGRKLSLAQFRGKPVMVNAWASW